MWMVVREGRLGFRVIVRLVGLVGLLVGLMVGLAGCQEPAPQQPPDAVSVRLKWVHQAQFAGFYAAAQQGYYAEENLDVTLLPGGGEVDAIDDVVSGVVDFGVSAPEQILLRRSQGAPIVAIATTYQHNPFVLVSHGDSGIVRPQDLAGHTLAIGGDTGLLQVEAMMKYLGLDINEVEIVPYTYDTEPFWRGEVDVVPSFMAGSLLNMTAREDNLNLIWPGNYGVLFYSDTIIATEETLAERPDVVLRFLRATLRGHEYAVIHPEEAATFSLVYAEASDPDVQLSMSLASIPLINTPDTQIGEMQEETWQQMYDILFEQGFLANEVDLSQVYTRQFLNEIYPSSN